MAMPLRRYWALLAHYLRPQRGRVVLLAVALGGTIALDLLNPQIVRVFLDSATAGDPLSWLVGAALLFIGATLVTQVLAVGATYLSEQVAWTATNALRLDLAAHCLRLNLAFHKARTPGELIERVDGDVTALGNFFSQLVIHLLGNVLLLLGVLGLLWAVDWRVGAAVAVFAVAALAVLLGLQAWAIPRWAAVRQMSAEFYGFLGEVLGGTEDVRANGATGYVLARFHTLLQRWWPLEFRASLAGYSMWSSTMGLLAIGTAVALGLIAWLWSSHTLTLGTAYVIFYYVQLLNRPLEQIRAQLQDLQKAGAAIGRVEALLDTRSALADSGTAALPPGAPSICFDAVTFAYEAEAPVLRDLTFTLPPGTVLGLLGRTGSGKSTIARLLARFYDPTAGTIRLGGVPLPDVPLRDLRRHVGLVTQEVQLFAATVRDNLTFFDRTVPDARILAVIADLGLGPWYATLPQGLDTPLAAGGGGLSAGEAQLLAFVRIFLADPGLVILDEASSRLDPATEALVEGAIARLLRGRTGIIIAHRLATVARAGRILILEDGQACEEGDRAALAADPASAFAGLLRTGLTEVLA